MKKGEKRAEGAAKEDDIVAVVDGSREGLFVCIEAAEDAVQDRVLRSLGGFLGSVEFDEFGIEWQDERKGYLLSKLTSRLFFV